MRPSLKLALAAVFLGGCAFRFDTDEPRMLDKAINATAAEVELHHAATMSAGDLAAVRAEADRHDAAMQMHLEAVAWQLDDWSCSDPRGMAVLRDLLESVRAREATHVAELRDATTLQEARDACDLYGADVDRLLDRMMNRRSVMDCGYDW